MKYCLMTLVFLFCVSSYASCLEKLWEDYRWSNGSAEYKQCIVNSSEFQAASNSLLCNPQKNDTSDEYKLYRDYQRNFDSKLAERDAATSAAQREFLNSEALSIENEWLVFGYRYEVLNELASAFKKGFECQDKF